MFSQYVGASPLWVLRRYRLQDAAALIDAGEGEDLAALAASLGFADQAHFTRAFTAVIGVPPSVYRAGVRPGAGETVRRADSTV
nr:helix-turn-helix domain-containing protein [Ornithinimicrobium sp. F0845]